MANGNFHFKQFEVKHDQCAQKVGTDGVLLGAWCRIPERGRVLDIGSGSGLISLMIAQRFPLVSIDAIELDRQAAKQGKVNFQQSPWSERLTQHCDNIVQYSQTTEQKYEAIVSNPPFFSASLKNPDNLRAQARHTDSLSFEELFDCVRKLLKSDGVFSLIIPVDSIESIIKSSTDNSLFINRITNIRPTFSSTSKRVLMEFCLNQVDTPERDELIIEKARHQYTKEYINLTKAFYLKM